MSREIVFILFEQKCNFLMFLMGWNNQECFFRCFVFSSISNNNRISHFTLNPQQHVSYFFRAKIFLGGGVWRRNIPFWKLNVGIILFITCGAIVSLKKPSKLYHHFSLLCFFRESCLNNLLLGQSSLVRSVSEWKLIQFGGIHFSSAQSGNLVWNSQSGPWRKIALVYILQPQRRYAIICCYLVSPSMQVHDQILSLGVPVSNFAFITMRIPGHFLRHVSVLLVLG